MTEKQYLRKRAALLENVKTAKEAYGLVVNLDDNDEETPQVAKLRDEYEGAEQRVERLDAAWEAGAVPRRLEQERITAESDRRQRDEGHASAQTALAAWVAVAAEIEKTAAHLGELAAREIKAAVAFQTSLSSVEWGVREGLLMDRVIYRGEVAKLGAAVVDPFYRYSVYEDVAIAEKAKERGERMKWAVSRAFGVEPEAEPVADKPRRRAVKKVANPADFNATPDPKSGVWLPEVNLGRGAYKGVEIASGMPAVASNYDPLERTG